MAPQEDWAEFWEHMRHAELTTLAELTSRADAGGLRWMATQLAIHCHVEDERAPKRSVRKAPQALVEHARAAA